MATAQQATGNVKAFNPAKATKAKDAIDAAVSAAEDRKEKAPTSAEKNTRAQQAEIDKHLDNIQQRSEKIVDAIKGVVSPAQSLVKSQAEFKNEQGAARESVKEKALGHAIHTLEKIAEARKVLNSMESDALTRISSTFDYAKKDVKQVLKERQFPKAQFELELNLNRNAIDSMHRSVEKMHPRRETEATNNGKSKKAA